MLQLTILQKDDNSFLPIGVSLVWQRPAILRIRTITHLVTEWWSHIALFRILDIVVASLTFRSFE
jgi:hypothetical protein